jgi:catechol 2,3-dioxygenase
MAADPVDYRGIIAEAEGEGWDSLEAGTIIGHMHLQVSDIEQAKAFYHDILGFDVVAQMPGALFVSAGGYHHHLGLNTWHSQNAPAAPADAAGLRHFEITFPNKGAQDEVVARLQANNIVVEQHGNAIALDDPFGNHLHLVVGAA